MVARDRYGHPGRLVVEGTSGGSKWQLWAKLGKAGQQAVLLINSGDAPVNVSVPMAALNVSGPCRVRDLWARADLPDHAAGPWEVTGLGAHDSRFVTFTPIQRAAVSAPSAPAKKPATKPTGLGVSIAADAGYVISVDGEAWLESGPTFITVNGKRLSSADGSLALVGVRNVSGRDAQLGDYHGWRASWRAASVDVHTTIRLHEGNTSLSFETAFPGGVPRTGAVAADWNGLLTAFPSFVMGPMPDTSNDESKDKDATTTLGYLTFSGRFIEASKAGPWNVRQPVSTLRPLARPILAARLACSPRGRWTETVLRRVHAAGSCLRARQLGRLCSSSTTPRLRLSSHRWTRSWTPASTPRISAPRAPTGTHLVTAKRPVTAKWPVTAPTRRTLLASWDPSHPSPPTTRAAS